jgi:hypothetical protein
MFLLPRYSETEFIELVLAQISDSFSERQVAKVFRVLVEKELGFL